MSKVKLRTHHVFSLGLLTLLDSVLLNDLIEIIVIARISGTEVKSPQPMLLGIVWVVGVLEIYSPFIS